MSGYLSGVLAVYLLNVIMAYGVFVPATAGIINLGTAGFVAIGAYLSAFINARLHLPPLLTLPLATAASFLVGLLIALPILRTRGVYMVLATIAFGEIVSGVVINIDAIGGAAGFPVTDAVGLGTIATLAAVVFVLVLLLMGTRYGIAVRAVHDDEPVAALFGVNVRLAKAIAFALGAGCAGLSGALYAHFYTYVEIATFSTALSIYTLLYVLIGGTQTAFGPLIGAAVYSLLPEVLRGADKWRYVIFAVVIIAIMALRPEGLITRRLLMGLGGRAARRRAVA